MKFFPIVVTAVSAFQLPFPAVNTINKASPSNPSCTGRFLYVDTDDDPSNGQPRVLITPPAVQERDEECIHRSLLAERLRLEQKNGVSTATATTVNDPDVSTDVFDDLSKTENTPPAPAEPARFLVKNPSPSATTKRDEELFHRSLLTEQLRVNKKKNKEAPRAGPGLDMPTMTMTDAVLVAPKQSDRQQQGDR